MKAEHIVKALISKLPFLTTRFCDAVAINTITSVGLLATATVSAGHGRINSELVTVTGATAPITITSITRTGATAVVVTQTDHDFTLSAREVARGMTLSAILTGATEAQFNGTFNILSVANRRTFTIAVADSGAASATGAPRLQNGSSALGGYNGSFNINVLSATQFTYPLQKAIPNAAAGAPMLNSGHRITGAVSIDRFLDAYTKQATDKWWACVVLGDVVASKGRQNRTDSTDQAGDNEHFQQTVTQPFGVYLVAPASSAVAARPQRDDAEDVVPLILRSLLRTKFPTGFSASAKNRATFTAHGLFMYNGPQYVHEITLEQNAEVLFDDSVGNDLDVAFRDFDLTLHTDLGTTALTAAVDLDEVAL